MLQETVLEKILDPDPTDELWPKTGFFRVDVVVSQKEKPWLARAKRITRGRIRTFKELACMLKSMGLEVTPAKAEEALAALYPQGLAKGSNEDLVIRNQFRYFSKDCRDGV